MTKYLLIAVIALSVAVALAAINQIRMNFTIRELERQQRRLQQRLERIQK